MAGNTFERMEKKVVVPTELVPALKSRIEKYMEPDAFNKGGEP